MKIRATLLCIAALAASLGPAHATPSPVVVATYLQFIPGQTPDAVEIAEGQSLYLTHQDAVVVLFYNPWHDIRSVDEADGEPLFESPLLAYGETAPITGVESLAPGTYEFYCDSHGSALMSGTLVVHELPV